jgi:minor histocompatibility antigen H13
MTASIFMAYVGLGIMAVVPIYYASYALLESSINKGKDEEPAEQLSSSDAYWFPVIGSCFLFGFYILFTFFPKEYINYLLTAYFAVFGSASVARLLSKMSRAVLPTRVASLPWLATGFRLSFENVTAGSIVQDLKFDGLSVICSILSSLFTAYYVWSKNWIASNIFGEAFSISAISMLSLDSFMTGIILLSGLFVYDIFWVFGTNVMVTVATSFDVPVKLLMPKSLFSLPWKEFAMLGLGDIVIPGIFVAMCLRFDHANAVLKRGVGNNVKNYPKPYFHACYVAYILGFVTTVVVMHTFKAAQPALLYLSPACILSTLCVAAVRRELPALFSFTTEKAELTEKVDGASQRNKSTTVDADTTTKSKKSPKQE